ncbi:hypothetical protein BCR37DRAFT_380393 [Protomyces lactucae-debilis]|uniref:DUS-like FMN-binding domain-containing protein n=1 Tax=Protomyces lactucae-debilis TaxID=2754530 RepID=A0A1Y2FC64_PROLT|nr:uncharacterized protein BCR37DRAFT_380393 [Protomyces lactucae-debilis]ORY81491.1 hypothetical protein BCR37DRAFT_380393 [Protomyces lactucae-debilis]
MLGRVALGRNKFQAQNFNFILNLLLLLLQLLLLLYTAVIAAASGQMDFETLRALPHDASHPCYRGDPHTRTKANNPITHLFTKRKAEHRPITVAAPMVRYSKLAFRSTVSHYDCDLVYTPMLLAKEFSNHPNARNAEFHSSREDARPLVVQFAAKEPEFLAKACLLVRDYTDAVGLNCGCPQSWACQAGIGAQLMKEPERVCALIRAARAAVGETILLEAKMRVHRDLKETVAWAQMVEASGVDWITCHGRTKSTRSSEPVDLEAIRLVRESVKIPVIANGDVINAAEARRIYEATGCAGVMSARGLFANPALFSRTRREDAVGCPWHAVERFMDHAIQTKLHPKLLQSHLVEMFGSGRFWDKKTRIAFMEERTTAGISDFIDARYVRLRPGEEGFAERETPIRKTVARTAPDEKKTNVDALAETLEAVL